VGPDQARRTAASLPDTRKAAKVFGFKERTSFEEGLGHTIDWYKSQQP